MVKQHIVIWTGLLALAALAFTHPIAATAEQHEAEAEPAVDVITVVAPRIRRERIGVGETYTAEKDAIVNFADLDITTTEGFFALEERINEAATQLCRDLADLFPRGQPRTPVCIRRAVDDAMEEAREIARMLAAT